MLTVLGASPSLSVTLILARTVEGRQRAKARGVRFGRKLKLTKHQQAQALVAARGWRGLDRDCADLQPKPLNDLQTCTTMTPLERRVKIALGAGLRPEPLRGCCGSALAKPDGSL